MAIYDLHLLQQVLFGENAVDQLGTVCQTLESRAVLVVTDRGIIQAGHVDRVLRSIQKASLEAFVFEDVSENPTTRDVDRGVGFARGCDPFGLIVAVGGGSPMDCAKGINMILTNGGKMEDYRGLHDLERPLLPAIGIPTTAGTGSEAQSYAVIADPKSGQKIACGDRKARFRSVILDPTLGLSMSPQLTATSGLDAVAHALESFVSTRRSPVSQMLAREAWRHLHGSLERAIMSPESLEARSEMLWGAHFAGAAIENSMLGSAHACANPLSARFGVPHGAAVALMLPFVVRANGVVAVRLYRELVRVAGWEEDREPASILVDWLQKVKSQSGMPLTLKECGVDTHSLPVLAREAAVQWTGQFNPKPMRQEHYLQLYEEAFE